MPAQAVAASGGVLSKLGVLKGFLGKIPRLFTYAFVIFIFISTVSQGFNKMQETGKISDFAISFGAAFIKPLVAADQLVFSTVSAYQPTYSFFQTLEAYLTLFGAITVIIFLIKWTVLGVKSVFPEGMNSAAAIYGTSFFILFLMMTTYHSLSTNTLSFGWSGMILLFSKFSIVFHPIISIGERFLGITNSIPVDANVPIFK